MEEQNSPYPFPQMMQQESSRDNLVMQTSPERIAELLEHDLRGEVWNDNEKIWKRNRTPRMNDAGVDAVITSVKNLINQTATLSNLSEKQISDEVIFFAEMLSRDFILHGKSWGIKPQEENSLFVSIILLVRNNLTRALGKTISDKELYQGTVQSRELVHIRDNQQQKKGFFSRFAGAAKEERFQGMMK